LFKSLQRDIINANFSYITLCNELTQKTDGKYVSYVGLELAGDELWKEIELRTNHKKFLEKLLKKIGDVTIKIEPISIHLIANEDNFGKQVEQYSLVKLLQKELSDNSLVISPGKADSDIFIKINAATRLGSMSNDMYVVYLDYHLSLHSSITGNMMYNLSKESLKGIHIDKIKAGLAAYEKGSVQFERQMISTLLEAIYTRKPW